MWWSHNNKNQNCYQGRTEKWILEDNLWILLQILWNGIITLFCGKRTRNWERSVVSHCHTAICLAPVFMEFPRSHTKSQHPAGRSQLGCTESTHWCQIILMESQATWKSCVTKTGTSPLLGLGLLTHQIRPLEVSSHLRIEWVGIQKGLRHREHNLWILSVIIVCVFFLFFLYGWDGVSPREEGTCLSLLIS